MDWKNIVKMSILPKAIYTLEAIPIKSIFHRARTKNRKICREPEKTPKSQSSLENKKAKLEASQFWTSNYIVKP